MNEPKLLSVLPGLFSELVEGAHSDKGAFVLNSGDPGILHSLDSLSSAEASQSSNGGATIAAHTQHLRYGLSLMNRWATEGGDPFTGANWGEAWKVSAVDDGQWKEIRDGLRGETQHWLAALQTPRSTSSLALRGMVGSIAHLAYHVGAIRQISKNARGPKDGA